MSTTHTGGFRQKKRRDRLYRFLSVCKTAVLILLLLLGLNIYNRLSRGSTVFVWEDTGDVFESGEASAVVHFIDVKQADAACIVLQSGETILIDAGSNDSEDSLLAYLARYGIRCIDYAVFSHPHEDHIGGADAVFDACEVKHVILPNAAAETSTYEILIEKIADEGCVVSLAEPGETYTVGDASFTVLGPVLPYHDDEQSLNNASIILRFLIGDVSFLFMGDTEADAEAASLRMFPDAFASDVLKVAHHGSSSSSSEAFLTAVSPAAAVISCGPQNEFGHPHRAVTDRLQALTDHIFRTDLYGSVRIYTDGETLLVRCDKNPDNQS